MPRRTDRSTFASPPAVLPGFIHMPKHTIHRGTLLRLGLGFSMSIMFVTPAPLHGSLAVAGSADQSIPMIPITRVSEVIHPPIDLDTADRFGCAVAASGQSIFIGNDGRRDGPPAAGVVTIHAAKGHEYIETHRLQSPESRPGDEFGAVLAVDDRLLVVGAPGMRTERGGAWVYRLTGDAWRLIGPVFVAGAASGDRFGESVSIGSDLILIGGPRADVGRLLDRGRVVVFRVEGDSIRHQGELQPVQSATGLRFGTSIAVGDRIEVGSPGLDAPPPPNEEDPIDRAGGVFRYESLTPHRLVAVLRRPQPDRLDRAGQSVVVASSRVVMSAPRATLGAPRSGVITVFDRPPRESGLPSGDEAGLGTMMATEADLLAATIPGRRDPSGRIDPAVRLGVVDDRGFRPAVDLTGLGRPGGLQRIAIDDQGERLAIGVLPPSDGVPSAGVVHVVRIHRPERPAPIQVPGVGAATP